MHTLLCNVGNVINMRDYCIPFSLQAVLRALYAVFNHDISSRVCDAALSIIECLLQLGIPGKDKGLSGSENKENSETRSRDGTNVRNSAGGMANTKELSRGVKYIKPVNFLDPRDVR